MKIGDRVQFWGYGASQEGTIERVGGKNVTVAYLTRADRAFYAEHPEVSVRPKRRPIRREFLKHLATDSKLVDTWTEDPALVREHGRLGEAR